MINDIFNSDGFGVVEMTGAINVVPNKYGRLNQLNLFPNKGIRTRVVGVEQKNGILNLLPTLPVGAPATQGTSAKRVLRSLNVPHIPHEDSIRAEDVQGVRAMGTDNQLLAFMDLVNEKLANMADKHFITLEHLRWGALKGLILDADGSTIYDLFDEFGVEEKEISFALTTNTTKVTAKARELKRYMEQFAKGVVFDHVHVFCGPDFWDAFIGHPEVEKFYTAFENRQRLDLDYRNGFEFQGCIWEEQAGSATDVNGNVRLFVPTAEARAIPMGASGIFETVLAPADMAETVNTPGLPLYASQERMKHNRGIEIHTQSNPLPICKRPELLVKLTKA